MVEKIFVFIDPIELTKFQKVNLVSNKLSTITDENTFEANYGSYQKSLLLLFKVLHLQEESKELDNDIVMNNNNFENINNNNNNNSFSINNNNNNNSNFSINDLSDDNNSDIFNTDDDDDDITINIPSHIELNDFSSKLPLELNEFAKNSDVKNFDPNSISTPPDSPTLDKKKWEKKKNDKKELDEDDEEEEEDEAEEEDKEEEDEVEDDESDDEDIHMKDGSTTKESIDIPMEINLCLNLDFFKQQIKKHLSTLRKPDFKIHFKISKISWEKNLNKYTTNKLIEEWFKSTPVVNTLQTISQGKLDTFSILKLEITNEFSKKFDEKLELNEIIDLDIFSKHLANLIFLYLLESIICVDKLSNIKQFFQDNLSNLYFQFLEDILNIFVC